jgi:uncharacterized membrane protein YesL
LTTLWLKKTRTYLCYQQLKGYNTWTINRAQKMRSKTIRNSLKNLTRRNKLILLILTDCIIAFLCWVVFGPPFSFMIASNFESSLFQIIRSNILSFIIPFIFTFSYFVWSGFYLSLMKFFDSKDSIFRALIGYCPVSYISKQCTF